MDRKDAICILELCVQANQFSGDLRKAMETLLLELEKDDDMINKLIFYIAAKEGKDFEDVEEELLEEFKELEEKFGK